MSGRGVVRFGDFELDSEAGELRLRGDVVKLPPQPFKVLALLANRSGEVVSRNEIRNHVWCDDTFVDFEQGLNFCVRQIREALGDTAGTPQFVETLPRRGYRFLMPVKVSGHEPPARMARLIVLPFRMLRPDPETEFLAFSLPDAITTSLSGLESLVVRSSIAASRYAGDSPDPKKIAAEADIDLIVTGALLRAADEVRVTTQLTDATSGTLLWSQAAQMAIGNVFQVQDELTQRIVASLSLPLTLREQKMLKRDVPASAKAYEYFLRGNQLSHDSKQWNVARDLYLRCVEEDPAFAPAWARLGRIHHVMAKYLETGTQEGLDRAEEAFQRALDLNPDLAMGHKLFAQLEVDLGRARDAMTRLTKRAQSADPEVLAGLVTTSRYCGLLDASVAAHKRALGLDPKIRTSVPHTWFLQGDHGRVAAGKVEENPYIVALSLGELGRQNEVVPVLRELEQTTKTRLRNFMIAARTLLEGKEAESVSAVGRIVDSDFQDPEGLFYLSRHLAHLNQVDRALGLLDRVVAGGFFCYPAMERDRWLDPLRDRPVFTKLMSQAETWHREAAGAFTELRGERALGVALPR